MDETYLFCIPKTAYIGMSLEEITKSYEKMAIEGFDELITFPKSFIEYLDKPDLRAKIVEPNQIKPSINVEIYANQIMKKIGEVKGNFMSTSYLFNPFIEEFPNSLFPDIDIVQLRSKSKKSDIKKGIKRISDFYKDNKWDTFILDGGFLKSYTIESQNPLRNNKNLKIVNPELLLRFAQRNMDYNRNRTYFNDNL